MDAAITIIFVWALAEIIGRKITAVIALAAIVTMFFVQSPSSWNKVKNEFEDMQHRVVRMFK